MEIDGVVKVINARVTTHKMQYDMILGKDFVSAFGIGADHADKAWHNRGGPWHPFFELHNQRVFFSMESKFRRARLAAEVASLTEMQDPEREQIDALVKRIVPEKSPARTNLIEHVIDVQGARPVKIPCRRYSPQMVKFIKEEVKKWHELGLIRLSQSEWSSAPVTVKKQDGSNRMCIDLRNVIKRTEIDAYPCPGVDLVLDKLRNAQYISKIDLESAYQQIPVAEDSKQYTAFVIPDGGGLWECETIIFGLVNAPATFVRFMDTSFGTELEPYVFKYINDIIIVTETFEEHLVWVEKALKCLVEAGLKINLAESEFGCSEVTFLRYKLGSRGLRPDLDRIQPVLDFPRPHNVKQLRRFLGVCGWYSRFIEHENELKVPVTKLTRKNQRWQWGEEQEKAFVARTLEKCHIS